MLDFTLTGVLCLPLDGNASDLCVRVSERGSARYEKVCACDTPLLLREHRVPLFERPRTSRTRFVVRHTTSVLCVLGSLLSLFCVKTLLTLHASRASEFSPKAVISFNSF